MAAVPELQNKEDWKGVLSSVDTVLFDCDGDWCTHHRYNLIHTVSRIYMWPQGQLVSVCLWVPCRGTVSEREPMCSRSSGARQGAERAGKVVCVTA